MRTRRRSGAAGFTLVELLVATAVAMVLLLGALYSTSESYAVVREGDARMHTRLLGRRSMERLMVDVRFASDVSISGDALSGWTIDLVTGVNDEAWSWSWSPTDQILRVSDGVDQETVITGLQQFEIETEAGPSGGVGRVVARWTLEENSGQEAGNVSTGRSVELSASSWVLADN